MSRDILVRGGMVVSPRQVFGASVGIKDGRIVAIRNAEYLPQADRVVDAAGCYVLLGIIDPHYHIKDWIAPGEEIIRSETASSLASGVTTIGLFVNWRAGEEPEAFIQRRHGSRGAGHRADERGHRQYRGPCSKHPALFSSVFDGYMNKATH